MTEFGLVLAACVVGWFYVGVLLVFLWRKGLECERVAKENQKLISQQETLGSRIAYQICCAALGAEHDGKGANSPYVQALREGLQETLLLRELAHARSGAIENLEGRVRKPAGKEDAWHRKGRLRIEGFLDELRRLPDG